MGEDRAWVVTSAPVVNVVPAGAGRVVIAVDAPDIAARSRPGQFVMASVPGPGHDPLLRRPLSIHNVTEDTVELLVGVVGRGTRFLAGLIPGQSLSLVGPLGTGFGVPPADRALLLVAGGIGIAPLLFAATVWCDARPVALAAGGRSAGDLMALDRFSALGLPVWVATDDGSRGYRGTVVDRVRRIIDQPPGFPGARSVQGWCIWACGPEPMLAAVDRLLIETDIPGRLSVEAVFACGVGACAGCARTRADGRGYVRVCRDGPVFNPGEVLL